MSLYNSTYRLKGRLPKIGLRPAIDGRLGGITESLEDQTMRMANNVEKLINKNLKHPDGSQVLLHGGFGSWVLLNVGGHEHGLDPVELVDSTLLAPSEKLSHSPGIAMNAV